MEDVSSKEKDSLLGDVDPGKDFFSSWKPMSVADGDGIDFDLTPGNKRPFNFDKALNIDSRKSRTRKDIKPVGNIGRLRKTLSPIAHISNSQRTRHTISRKRKTLQPRHHKGTTVVGISCFRKYLCVVSDGRRYAKNKDGWYPCAENDEQKISTIGKNYIASMAGSCYYGRQLIKELADIYEETQMDMKWVIQERELDVTEWEKDTLEGTIDPFEEKRGKNVYPASVVVYGFDQEPVNVASKGMGVEEIFLSKNLKVVAHGSGGKLALKHLMGIKHHIKTLYDALECIKECFGAVFLQTNSCGGNIKVVTATPRGGIDLSHEGEHPTSIVARHFDSLNTYMESMIIFYSPGSYLKSHKLEGKKEKYLKATFPGLKIGIVGYDEASSRTVRWLVFPSPSELERFKITPLKYFGDTEYCDPTRGRFKKLSKMFNKSKCEEVCHAEGPDYGKKANTQNEDIAKSKPVQRQSETSTKDIDILSEVRNGEGGLDKIGEKAATLSKDRATTKPVKRQREMSKKDLDTLRSYCASFSNLAPQSTGNPTTLAMIPTSNAGGKPLISHD